MKFCWIYCKKIKNNNNNKVFTPIQCGIISVVNSLVIQIANSHFIKSLRFQVNELPSTVCSIAPTPSPQISKTNCPCNAFCQRLSQQFQSVPGIIPC